MSQLCPCGSAVEYSLCCHPLMCPAKRLHLIQNISCVRVTALL
ncbi:SEC-C domain-containing protein [Escherichia coli]|nr:SEC-C domain-containing protein [Escherichia coli]